MAVTGFALNFYKTGKMPLDLILENIGPFTTNTCLARNISCAQLTLIQLFAFHKSCKAVKKSYMAVEDHSSVPLVSEQG